MLKGKHIMILVIILLVSLINLAIYLHWDAPSERDWKIGLNYTIPMIIILSAEIGLIVIYIGFKICENWNKWWNSEIKLPKQW